MAAYNLDDMVTVKSFEARVVGTGQRIAVVEVKDHDGHTHFIHETQIEKPLPYADGALYIDIDRDVFRFHAAKDNAPAYWTQAGPSNHSTKWSLEYPTRPLRAIGDDIEE